MYKPKVSFQVFHAVQCTSSLCLSNTTSPNCTPLHDLQQNGNTIYSKYYVYCIRNLVG